VIVLTRNIVRRRSIRLPGFDYSQPGAYFLTICSAQRTCIFGSAEKGQVLENELGKLVRACWLEIPQHFPTTETDAFIIMPNHLHAILNIRRSRLENNCSRQEVFSLPTMDSVPTIVRTFKAAVTWQARKQQLGSGEAIWQRDYYEHVIRDENEYVDTCRYISLNPLRWDLDENHPSLLGRGTIYRAPTRHF